MNEPSKTLLDAVNAPLLLCRMDGRIIYANPAAEVFFGVSSAELCRFLLADLTHPSNRQFLMEWNTAAVSTVELRLMTAHNRLVVAELTSKLVEYDNAPAQLITFQDVSALKRMALELQSVQARVKLLQDVIDTIEDDLYVKDQNSRFVFVNRAGYEYFGLQSAEPLLGKNDVELFGAVAQWLIDDERRVLEQGETLTYQKFQTMPYLRGQAAKNRTWLSVTKMPLRDDEGQIIGLIGMNHDITSLVVAEEQVQADRALMRTVIDLIPDVLWVKDKDFRYILINKSYVDEAKRLGLDSDFIGLTDHDFLPAERAARSRADEEFILRTGEPILNQEEEFYFPRERRTYSVSKVPLRNAEGQIIGIVSISRDMTQQRLMARLVLEQEKLQVALNKEQELNDLKSKMMTRISHEFRTPLAKIQLASELLTRYNTRITDEQRERSMADIREQISYLTEILSKISYFIRGVFDATDFTLKVCDLRTIVRQIVQVYEASTARQHEFAFVLKGNVFRVLANEEFLTHIVDNLLSNAVKYSPVATTITIELGEEDDEVILRVSDAGIGIAPAEQKRIFEPFYRGENINEVAGIGLGLSIVRFTVELLGGSVDVDSEPGKGAVFTVTLPLLPVINDE